jgi:predicted acyl esterase
VASQQWAIIAPVGHCAFTRATENTIVGDYFAPGHRLRIEVSSSNFPRFDRNLNTGGNNYDESKGVVAHNSVHHSKQYPSHITVSGMRR